MKVRARFPGLAALAIAAAAVSAVPALAASSSPPRSQLSGYACTRALDPGSRAIAIKATMRPLDGTRKMAMRFELLQRSPGMPVEEVTGGDLGTWRTPSNPTLGQLPGDIWRVQKSVYNLDVPFNYQFRVTFRWTGPTGKVIGTATRYTKTCHQVELRPDLAVKSITVAPITGHPNKELYTAVITNQGLTGAGPFQVLFAPGDSSAPTTDTIAFLGPGRSRTLTFTGPVCDSTSPPSVSADSASQVDDFDRTNNVLDATCPASPTTTGAKRQGKA